MPILATLFFLSTVGNFGFPLTLNFLGEFLIIIGLAHSNFFIFFFSAFGLFISIIYAILLYNKLMFGNLKRFIGEMRDVSFFEFNAISAVVFFTIFFGI